MCFFVLKHLPAFPLYQLIIPRSPLQHVSMFEMFVLVTMSICKHKRYVSMLYTQNFFTFKPIIGTHLTNGVQLNTTLVICMLYTISRLIYYSTGDQSNYCQWNQFYIYLSILSALTLALLISLQIFYYAICLYMYHPPQYQQ